MSRSKKAGLNILIGFLFLVGTIDEFVNGDKAELKAFFHFGQDPTKKRPDKDQT